MLSPNLIHTYVVIHRIQLSVWIDHLTLGILLGKKLSATVISFLKTVSADESVGCPDNGCPI